MIAIASMSFLPLLYAQPKSSQSGPSDAGRMIQQLHARDWILRAAALDYLAKFRVREAMETIRSLVVDQSAQPWLRGRALVAIARIDDPAASPLVVEMSRHEDTHLRGAAAEAMQYLAGTEIDRPLNDLLKDKEPGVRFRALAAYANRHGTKAWPVVEPMTRSLDASSCEWGARALALVGNDDSLGRLATLAERQELQTLVTRGLRGVQDPKLIDVLLKSLAGAEPDDRRFSAGLTALQEFDEKDINAALKTNLASGDANRIRTVASVVTSLTRDPSLGDGLRLAALRLEEPKTIAAVLSTLGQGSMLPDRHRDFFVKYMDHADVEIRTLAIRGLAHCSNVDLYKQLHASMADKSPMVVEAALGTLLRSPAADSPRGRLIEYLQSPLASPEKSVRTLARALLAHAGTADDFKPAMELFGKQLRSTDNATRAEAASVLGNLAPLGQFDAVVRAQGYLARWMVVGTFFSGPKNADFALVGPPEEKIDFQAKYIAKYAWSLSGGEQKKGELERVIGWTKASVDQVDGKLNLPPLLPPPAVQAIAYAVADIEVPADRQVFLNVDGDDAFRVWLNGKKVAEKIGEYKPNTENVVEEFGIKISLRAGSNRFLVKTANIDRDWWIRLRLTDSDGRPVEFGP